MDGGSSAPPAPDYTGAANATAAGNLANLKQQTVANRPNQVTPWGTSSWANTPSLDQAGYDAAMATYNNQMDAYQKQTAAWNSYKPSGSWQDTNGSSGGGQQWVAGPGRGAAPVAPTAVDKSKFQTDNWTQTLQLTPAEQTALNNQQDIQNNQSQLAKTLQGQVQSTMAGGFHAPSMSDYMSGVGSVNQNFGGFTPYGVGATDQSQINPGFFTQGNQGVNQNFRSSAQGQNQNFWSGTPGLMNSFGSSANGVNQNFNSGANGVNQNFSSSAGVNTDPSAFTAGASHTNLSAPEFNDANLQTYSKSAYDAAHGLIADQQQQDTTNLDSKLRLQGLTPGTEAYNAASQNLGRVQAQQNNQIANQSVLTGNQMANTDYASALAGYNAGNAAQGQAYGQGANSFSLANTAQGQQFGQDLSGFNADNTAQGQQFGQDLSGFNANNAAVGQQFGQDATGFGLTNGARNTSYANALAGYNSSNAARNTQTQNSLAAYQAQNQARTQGLTNSLSQYQAALQGQSAYNTAQNQGYSQALAGYGANTASQQAGNQAQQQAYEQGLGSYGTAYQSALQNYLQPLNNMNAVLNGNQVSMPSMPGFATAGYTPGADQSGATQALGSWNQGVYNSNQASAANSNNSTMGSVAMIAAAFI